MGIDLPKGLKRNTHDDQQTCAAEIELNIKFGCQDGGHNTQSRKIQGPNQG
jgi:hypothetical protein